MPRAIPTYLEEATIPQLLRAVADNHRQCFAYNARRAGGAIHRQNGLTWTEAPGAEGQVEILFPHLSPAAASAELDRLLAYCRERRPLRSVSCWTLLPSRPLDLGARLVARGFEWGWQPHWMACDLSTIPDDTGRHEVVQAEGDVPNDLPYASAGPLPRAAHQLVVLAGGRPVGHVAVNPWRGVAGIYDMGVADGWRRQGMGVR